MRKANRHMKRPYKKLDLARSNPVAKPYALQTIESHLRTLKVNLYVAADGQDATHLLAGLAWMLALALKVELGQRQVTQPARLIHGALRSVQWMCLRGYRWRADGARALEVAVEQAHKVLLELSPHVQAGMADAQYLCDRVKAHAITESDVLGAELYDQFKEAA